MGHHYVPRQYLRGFEVRDEPGFIWMYDKKQLEFRKAPIAVVAQESDYYDADTEEQLNLLVEGPGHAVLGRIRCKQRLRLEDRMHLAHYVATMIVRGPRHRRRAWELLPSVLEASQTRAQELLQEQAQSGNVGQEVLSGKLLELEDIYRRLRCETPPEVVNHIRSPWASERVQAAVHDMAWRIVIAPDANHFLTSDNPACFFESEGLAGPETELTFPIASDLALAATWRGPQASLATLHGRPNVVKEFNRRVAAGAERFVFYDERTEWVATLADKQRPRLNRIRW